MKIDFVRADLKLAHTFKTSRSSTDVSRSYFLKYDGAVGEASPVRFYGETGESVEAAWKRLSPVLSEEMHPRVAWPCLNRALGYNFALKCGIDLLLWDRLGRLESATVRELLEVPGIDSLLTAFSIGIDDPERMREEVRHRAGFRVYKLKVGFEGDLEAVEAVRRVTDVPLYVDANGGWSVEEACRKLPVLEAQNVVLCEQPIFSGERDDWERVRAATSIPVIVDEYCQRPDDVAHWAGWVDGINVKLQKCGGITPAYQMIRHARDLGMKVMLGCMIESSVGIAAAAQLAPLADYLDLDSHLYLENDPYQGIECKDGRLMPSGRPGLGVWEAE